MKKVIIAIVLVLALCAGAVALVACNPDGTAGDGGSGGGGGGNAATFDNKSTIGFSVASSAVMLDTFAQSSASSSAADGNADTEATLDTQVEQAFENEFTKQLSVIESFIDRASVNSVESASDRPEYDHMLTVTTTDMRGNESVYILYYNATPVIDDDNDKWDDEDDWDIETEEEFRIDGVLVYNDAEYDVRGEMENEVEGNESENEFEMTAFDRVNNSKIVFEQSFEVEDGEYEEEYKYSYYENNRLVNSFEIEFENENGKEELDVTFIEGGGNGNWANTMVAYERETDGNGDFISITLRKGTTFAKLKAVSVAGGEYRFTFFVEYTLAGNAIEVRFTISSRDSREMPCALGFHPAFMIPEPFEAHRAVFPQSDMQIGVFTSDTRLWTGRTAPYHAECGSIPLSHGLFDDDALILSEYGGAMSIADGEGRDIIRVISPDFPRFGLWQKPKSDAPFVCLEPWSSYPGLGGVLDDIDRRSDFLHIPAGGERMLMVRIEFPEA